MHPSGRKGQGRRLQGGEEGRGGQGGTWNFLPAVWLEEQPSHAA